MAGRSSGVDRLPVVVAVCTAVVVFVHSPVVVAACRVVVVVVVVAYMIAQ